LDTDAPNATTAFVKNGHNFSNNGRRKKSFVYDHLHILLIICASLKEIRQIVNEELMPQDLVDVRM
jgi:hypothetical protein